MIFGGLSEKEIKKISELLDTYKVSYEVNEDQIIKESNDKSIKYDLRHLNSPSISTHILSIEINDTSFENMDEELEKSLLTFGITNKAPEGFEESTEQSVSELHGKMLEGNRRLIGFENLYLVIISGIIMILFVSITFMNDYFESKDLSLSQDDIRIVGSLSLRNEIRNREDYFDSIQKRERKKEENRVIELLLERTDLEELNESFLLMFKDVPLNLKEETHRYIRTFSFSNAFKKEISILTKEDIYALGEIEENIISTKLYDIGDTIDDDILKHNKDKNFPIFSPSHYNKIKKIVNYIDLYDSMILFQRQLLTSASFIRILSDNKKLDRNQIEIKSLLLIKDYLKEQKPYIRKIVDITYYRLSDTELDDYYDFLIKYNAKRFLKKYDTVFERIFYKFTDEIYRIETQKK
jgi:hypothetical protein